jgi:beta-phosphoglucomutase-like phosphatase (HAD superfamily)
MIKAVIFDMDGTMVDSEKLWGDVGIAFATRYNVTMNKEITRQMMGKKDSGSLLAFKEYFHLNESVDELTQVRRKMIMEDTGLIRVNAGLYELLDLLDRLKIKKAVATSAFKEFTKKVLSGFDLEKRFDAIITGDDVVLGKPDPTIFLEAAKLMGIPPKECLVIEDAENGVEAAYRAEMRVFAIPHQASDHHDFSKATKILHSMTEITEEILVNL